MAFSFELEQSDGYLRAVLVGEASFSDLTAVMDAMTDAGEFSESLRLWDLQQCELQVTTQELRDIAAIGNTRDRPSSRVAILAGQDLTYGLARIVTALRESGALMVEVFRQEEDALAWLKGGNSDDDAGH